LFVLSYVWSEPLKTKNMNHKDKVFDIISFTANEKQYYPASMKRENWMPDSFVKHTEVEIALGQSRYGGPIADLPKDIEHPKNLRFAGQFDLSKFSPFDKSGLLPKTGQLIFFADVINAIGKVIYADVPNESLIRTIKEHEDFFFLGVLVDKIYADTETMSQRLREPENEWEKKHVNNEGKFWDYFSGSEKSKMFGIYTHCQLEQRRIEAITFSDKVLLLQIGTNGFNDEGVFSVLINKNDLINRNFGNCKFAWGQS
jgi:uncharacterized protein YwqG